MYQLFEFGQYWDTGTFILFLSVGIVISLLAKRGAVYSSGKSITFGEEKNNERWVIRVNYYYIFIFIILAFLYGFRSRYVGADTNGYVERFLQAEGFSFSLKIDTILYSREPLYELVNYLIRLLTDSYTVYFLVLGCFISFSYTVYIAKFWKKEGSFIFIVAMIVEYQYGFNVLRSAVATGFILLSLCSLKDEKYIKAGFIAVLGTLYHYSAIVQVPLVILAYAVKRKDTIKKRTLILLIGAIIGLLVGTLPLLSNIFTHSRFHSYIESSDSGNLLGRWYIILTIFYAIYLLIYEHKYENLENSKYITIITCLYNLVLMVMNSLLGAYRLTNFYGITRLCLWDSFPLHYKQARNNRLLIILGLFIVCIIYILFRMSRYSAIRGFRYEFVWNSSIGV